MIVFSGAYLLQQAGTSASLTNPRIGYRNYLRDNGVLPSGVTVSSETADGPRDAPLRADTAEYWQPVTLPATWQVDLGQAMDIDYVGLAGHSFGTNHNGVKVQVDSDPALRDPYIPFAGASENASTPDTVANSVVSNLDIRMRVSLNDWTPAAENYLMSKGSSGNQSWIFGVTTSGQLILYVSLDGANWDGGAAATSSVVPTISDGQTLWIRATRASTGVVTFYTSPDGVTWTQLGTTVAKTAGNLFDSTGTLAVRGNWGTGGAGYAYYAELRNGIGGPVVAKFDPSLALDGATTVTSDTTGEVWTIANTRVYNNVMGGVAIAPSDDAPLLFLDTSRFARYVRVTLTGGTVPQLGVVYVGKMLAMPYTIYGGHTPINMGRQTTLRTQMSRGGQFLGQTYRRFGVKGGASFKNLPAAWYRTNMEPFVKEARKFPFFFAWRAGTYPNEVGFVWCPDDIIPTNMGKKDWMAVSFNMVGIGNE